jgi:hypothetical protein
VNTKGYKGNILKRARIYTNEPGNKYQAVGIKAFVKVLIIVSVRHVYLRGPADQILTKTVGIRAGMDKPLSLEQSQFTLTGKVTYRIEELEPGKNFRLHFTSIPGKPGTYRGVLKLKTNYPEKPELIIPIVAQFGKASQGQKNQYRSKALE